MDDIPPRETTEEAVTRRAREFWSLPRLESVRDLAARDGGRASRLYCLTNRFQLVVTVVLGKDSRADVTFARTSEAAPTPLDGCAGRRPLPREAAQRFLDVLGECGAWELPVCLTNTRDGVLFYHVIAEPGREHAIEMDNPDLHSDAQYVRIANLYSAEFLAGELTMTHSPHPEYVLRGDAGRDNPPMQRTGAAGMVSFVRKLLGRGSGR